MSHNNFITVLSYEGDKNSGFARFQIFTRIYQNVGWLFTKYELASEHTQVLDLFWAQNQWWHPGKDGKLGELCDLYIGLKCGKTVYSPHLFGKCNSYLIRQKAEKDYKDHLNLHAAGI